jgi:hypothetical protein
MYQKRSPISPLAAPYGRATICDHLFLVDDALRLLMARAIDDNLLDIKELSCSYLFHLTFANSEGERFMAKKAADSEFNMSEAIREVFKEDPKIGAKNAFDGIQAKFPSAKINRNSFSVAYYTLRKKLGIKSAGRGRKMGTKNGVRTGLGKNINLAMLQTTAKFLSEVGGAEAAMEAIKQVQAIQVK